MLFKSIATSLVLVAGAFAQTYLPARPIGPQPLDISLASASSSTVIFRSGIVRYEAGSGATAYQVTVVDTDNGSVVFSKMEFDSWINYDFDIKAAPGTSFSGGYRLIVNGPFTCTDNSLTECTLVPEFIAPVTYKFSV